MSNSSKDIPSMANMTDEDTVQAVNEAYSAKAQSGTTEAYAKNVAQAFGYTAEQLQTIPAESQMGLGCGNPLATTNLKEGEVVVDLGSGGGIDVLLSATKVGATGQVIGLDMSTDMINLARRNAKRQNLNPPRVSFVQTLLTEELPIVSELVDCIISNCVINLLPLSGKANVLKESFRILKPGGRIVVSDIVAKKPLPGKIKNDLAAYVGCIAGAIEPSQYEKILKDAGFQEILFVDTNGNINVYFDADIGEKERSGGCCSSAPDKPPRPDFDANAWVGSYQIYAIKPKCDDVLNVSRASVPALKQWWDAYPTVKAPATPITADEVAALIRDPTKTASDFAVIDVRRNDHSGGHVRGSHQWAAQTFFNDLPAFFEQFKNTKKVIFYCNRSNGRGPRSAGWYQDYLNVVGSHFSAAYVMQGGIVGWLEKFAEDENLVDRD